MSHALFMIRRRRRLSRGKRLLMYCMMYANPGKKRFQSKAAHHPFSIGTQEVGDDVHYKKLRTCT
jgi:hypothetical protein